MKKRGFAFLLVLIFSAAIFPVNAFAASNGKYVTLRYIVGSKDEANTFWYSDELFNQSSYQFRKDLALMTFGLSSVSGASKDARNEKRVDKENQNYISFARQCGFKNIQSNKWMTKIPEKNSMGVNFSEKKIQDNKGKCTLIAMGIRGSGYRSEWYNNFDVGFSGEHKGFRTSRDIVLKTLKNYIRENKISGRIKVWFGSYSRGAAVANMVAGKLDDGYALSDAISLDRNDIYCYTFEPPMGAEKSEVKGAKYNNIHNIVNPADLVCFVGLPCWDFARYGVDHILPTKSKEPQYARYDAQLTEKLKSVPNDCNNKYWPDDYHSIGNCPETQEEYLQKLITALSTSFVTSREDFVLNVQPYFQTLLMDYNALEDKKKDEVIPLILNEVEKNASQILTGSKTLSDVVLNCLNENGYSSYNSDHVKQMLTVLSERLLRMEKQYPDITATMLANVLQMFWAHSGGPCYSWISILPEDYLIGHTAYSWQQ